ncbi:Uncharacterised protein [uncultured archaeon]|nr:Uncharacterised protein [uncultured archaeon]
MRNSNGLSKFILWYLRRKTLNLRKYSIIELKISKDVKLN